MSDPSTPPLVHTSTPAPPSHRSSSSPRSRPASIASTASKASWPDRFRTAGTTLVTHATKHTGVGLVCAVAYFDPGNWGVDLQAGSEFGYRLLFIVLLAGLLAVYWQVMASRLGVVTGLDLATHIRLLLHSRDKHRRLIRWGVLYPLYVITEAGIVATDLAELLGSGIALCLLFPSLPLWGGVLLTSVDVFLLLLIKDPLRGKPVRVFEVFVGGMVVAVLICMAVIIGRIGPNWGKAFEGFLPSKHIVQNGGLYVSIGIVGATVMPHSLFLGSALSAQDRLSPKTKPKAQLVLPTTLAPDADATLRSPFRMALTSLGASIRNALMPHRSEGIGSRVNRHVDHSNRALSFVKAHLRHAIADVVSSLLGFAVIINSFILVLAAAVFFYSPTGPTEGPASLFDAHALIAERVGRGAATLFAVALLFSGQSSALIGTLAGQVVADGFVRWNAPPVVRRILTRSVALIPGMIVAAVQGKDGIDALLVASQVVLAGVLPFVTLPLLILTSDKGVMSVRRSSLEERERARDEGEVTRVERELDQQDTDEKATVTAPDAGAAEVDDEEMVSFANGKIVQAFGYISWLLLVIANIYVLVELGQGKGGSH